MDTRLLWLALGGFAGANEGFLIGSILPAIASDTGVTVGQAGVLVLVYALAYGIGTPVLTTILGRTERRTLLTAAEATFAASAFAIALVPEFVGLVAARLLLALGAGLYTATALATAVALAPPEQRGRALGIVVGGQSLAVLAGVPVGALIVSSLGWRSIYFIIAGLGAVAALAVWLMLPRGLHGDIRTLRERLAVLRIPGVPAALLTTILFMLGAYIPLIFVGPMALYCAGLDRSALPLVLLANGIGAFAGSSVGGRLADRIGAHRTVTLATAAMAVVLLVLVGIPFLPGIAAIAAFLAVLAAMGFIGWGFWPAQSSHLATISPPPSVPLAVSLNLTALNLGVAVTAAVGGATLDMIGVAWLAPTAVVSVAAALVPAAYSVRRSRATVGDVP